MNRRLQDARDIQAQLYERLRAIQDPELHRSIIDLGMITNLRVVNADSTGFDSVSTTDTASTTITNTAGVANTANITAPIRTSLNSALNTSCALFNYDVHVDVELTVANCPLSQTITEQISAAVRSYPDAHLEPHIHVATMSQEKLHALIEQLKSQRRKNPFTGEHLHTRVIGVVSGKGGVGKSSVSANLAATFAALGYDTAAIDADIYGFCLPQLFGVHTQPTNLNGMLVPVEAWGVKLISIGMFAGSERAILWRGPRLQRSLEQFLSDIWWDNPDVLILDLPPGTGDMAINVAQMLPNIEIIIVTTPHAGAADIASRSGLMARQIPMNVRGVVENMSYFEHRGERLEIFGSGGGKRVSEHLTQVLGKPIPLLAQIPFEPYLIELAESGRPAVLDEDGKLQDTALSQCFVRLAQSLLARDEVKTHLAG